MATFGRRSGGGGGSSNTILARAQTLLGSTITKVMGTDFDNDQWYRTSLVSGTVTPSITDTGGVVTLDTTATAGRSAYILPHGAINLLDNAATSRWYAVWRTRITTTVDAAANLEFRLAPQIFGNPQLLFGAVGSVSTGFFSYLITNSGGSIIASGPTTVAIDTSYHVFEVYCDTANIYFTIDGVLVATVAASNGPPAGVTPMLDVNNGATNATRTMKADYLYLCTGEPAT